VGAGGSVAGSAGSGGSGGSAGSTGADAAAGSGGASEAGPSDARTDVVEGGPNDAAVDADPACSTIPTNATITSHLRITTDNECEVFVNGTSVGTTANWQVAVTIDVSLFLHPGRKNVVAVRGTNTSSQGGNDRGIIGELTLQLDGGTSSIVVTNDTWRVSKTEETNWTSLTFDDSAWIAATEIANHGDGPWGAVLGTSTAKWIWSAAVPASTNDKPNLETAYARKTFYFSTNGTTVGSTPGCP
jgi:hypothetical protein